MLIILLQGNIIGYIPEIKNDTETLPNDAFLHIKGKSDSSEAILICLDHSVLANRLFEGFKVFSEKQNILAKDVIVAHFSKENIQRALNQVDSFVASLYIKVNDHEISDGCVNFAELKFDSASGVLPNLDLFSSSSKILEIQRINRRVGASETKGTRIFSWIVRRLGSIHSNDEFTKYSYLQ